MRFAAVLLAFLMVTGCARSTPLTILTPTPTPSATPAPPTPTPSPIPTFTPTPVPTRPTVHVHPTRTGSASQGLVPQSHGSVQERIAAAWPGDDAKALRVVRCETGGSFNPREYDPPYYGLWQFDVSTWRGAGGRGHPIDASVEYQTQMAWKVFKARGWSPWPVCGKR